MITIVLADDHPIVRQGLRSLLATEPDFQVVGEAADGLATAHMVERLRPDVLVVDLIMPALSGLDVIRRVRALPAPPQIVVFSIHAEEVYVLDALRSGAVAYVLKESDTGELLAAVRAAAAGQHYLSSPLSDRAIERYAHQSRVSPLDPFDLLTTREREVLQLVVEGHTSVAIADRLSISPRTAETHRANLMRKLGLHNHSELTRFAAQHDGLARL